DNRNLPIYATSSRQPGNTKSRSISIESDEKRLFLHPNGLNRLQHSTLLKTAISSHQLKHRKGLTEQLMTSYGTPTPSMSTTLSGMINGREEEKGMMLKP